jgi:hypothetical protein
MKMEPEFSSEMSVYSYETMRLTSQNVVLVVFVSYLTRLSATLAVGRAIAQAVSSRLATAAARVRSQVRSCGICGGQSGTGTGFLRVLRLPLPILIPPTTPHSSSIMWGWYNRPISGRRTKWTQFHPTQRN